MSAVTVAGVAVVICLLAVTVRQVRPEFSTALLIIAGCAVAASILAAVLPTLRELEGLALRHGLSEGFAIVLKTIGICFITQTAADICRDAACASLASKIETAGKIAVLVVVFPLFRTLLDTAIGIMNG